MPIRIYKRGKIWHYAGTVSGRRLRGSTKATDKQIAQQIAADIEQAAWKRRLHGPGAGLTMAQVFQAYLDAEKPTRFLLPIATYWRDTPLAEVTSGKIRQSAISLYPNAGPATRNRHVIVPTQAAINHCAQLGWCAPMKVKRFPVVTKPKEFATDEWVSAFEAHASAHLGALCRTMFETGARLGEAVSLTWADIDFEKRTIRIRQTKVADERLARMTPKVMIALANLETNRRPDGLVFGYQRGDSVRQTWLAVVERAGIERMTPHSCRHGFATAMLRGGVDIKTVARWGGWKDVRILLETYAHAIDDPTVVDSVFDTKLTRDSDAPETTISKIRRN